MSRLRTPRADDAHRDDGAVLVFALILLTVGMLIITTLAFSVSNDLTNSSRFAAARSLEYAESSAMSQAIQAIRFTPLIGTNETLNASPPSYCWGSGPSSTLTNLDGVSSISVWCSTVWNPTSTNTRTVTLSACVSSLSASTCSADPGLRSVVTFDDYPAGSIAPNNGACVVYCGTSMAVDAWDWTPAVPTVTSLSVTKGPVTGGTSITVTGTGFVSGATVNFVEEFGGAPAATNTVLAGTSVVVTGATSLTVSTPAIIDGYTYYLEVTTPVGTSALTAASVFTFQATTPTVTALSSSTGVTAGGSSLTITGTGFTTGAVVTFTEESNGTDVSGAVPFTGNDQSITSPTTITVVTPAVTAATTFFVTVATTGGTSSQSTRFVFTFTGLVPTVSSVSPATGSPVGGTNIIVLGTGFVTGATVTLVPKSGHGTLTATTVTVASGTTLTAYTPAGTAGGVYYITVATPYGTSSNTVTFTYT